MTGIVYQNNHNIPEKVIINILEALGCEKINKNDSYIRGDAEYESKKNGPTLVPDFVCLFNKKTCAVEIGTLHETPRIGNRVSSLLENYNFVIHIFADKDFFILHCILYEKKSETTKTIRNQINDLKTYINKINLNDYYEDENGKQKN